jgi:hypothetical protein
VTCDLGSIYGSAGAGVTCDSRIEYRSTVIRMGTFSHMTVAINVVNEATLMVRELCCELKLNVAINVLHETSSVRGICHQ